MSIEQSYNFRKVSDELTSSGVLDANGLNSLQALGYEVLIDLLPSSHQQANPEERKIVESQGVEYIHIPVDFSEPKVEELRYFYNIMDRVGGKKVHMHCAANWRVSAFYSAYAFSKGVWSERRALEFITDLWDPREYSVWEKFLHENELRL